MEAEYLKARFDALREANSPEEALALLDTCPVEGHDGAILLMRALALNDLGRFEEALAACSSAIESEPDCLETRFAQAFALYMLQRWQEAMEALDALVLLAPAFADAAWLRAGLMRRLRGDLDAEVLAAFDLAAEIDPNNLYLRVERADLLRSAGRYIEAHELYSRTRLETRDEALRLEATFNLGCVALVLQDIPSAREAFHSVCEASPDYPNAREMLQMLKESSGI